MCVDSTNCLGTCPECVQDTSDEEYEKQPLPLLCLDLRMQANGSAMGWDESRENDVVAYLRRRLDAWRPSVGCYERFDNAVREMVVAALAEVDWWRGRSQHARSDAEEP